MGVYNATVITTAGQNLIADAIAGGEAVNFSSVKTSTHVYPAGTSLQNLTALDDVKQSVAPTSVQVYGNNVVQISARVPNTGISTAYLINTIGLFGQVTGGTETLIAVLTAVTPDEVPEFDPESPAAFIFNVQMTIQNADTITFEVNDSGTATVADLNRVAQTFSGATSSAAGTVGRVPAPAAGADGKFLRGDATWAAPADMVENFTSSDVVDGSATTWTSVSKLDSGETNASIFAKVSQMFKNIRFLYASAIKNITRNGKTFTATRTDGTTFTFDQQDTTYGLASTSADGLLRKLDNNTAHYMRGDGTWQTPPNTTYGLASTTANGLLRQLDNNTAHYMRGDGTWQTPPNTNTWRPVQNTLTSTSTTDSLSANMGNTLWNRMNTIGQVLVNGTGTQTITNAWKNVGQITLTPGTWIVFGEARSAASQQGKNYTLRFSFGSYRQTCYIPTSDNASACIADTWTVTANTVIYAQVWSSSVTIDSGGMTAIRIRNF